MYTYSPSLSGSLPWENYDSIPFREQTASAGHGWKLEIQRMTAWLLLVADAWAFKRISEGHFPTPTLFSPLFFFFHLSFSPVCMQKSESYRSVSFCSPVSSLFLLPLLMCSLLACRLAGTDCENRQLPKIDVA